MDKDRPAIFLYTDGASSGNPGPGGYGVVLRCGGHEKEMSGGFARTTNNRMELLAVIKGLEAIKWDNAVVEVFSDSTYVVKAVNEGWLQGWELAVAAGAGAAARGEVLPVDEGYEAQATSSDTLIDFE